MHMLNMDLKLYLHSKTLIFFSVMFFIANFIWKEEEEELDKKAHTQTLLLKYKIMNNLKY